MIPPPSETDSVIHVEVDGQPGIITNLNAIGLPVVHLNGGVLGRPLLDGERIVIRTPPPQQDISQ